MTLKKTVTKALQHALCQLDACGELTREQQLNANFAEQLKPRPAVRGGAVVR